MSLEPTCILCLSACDQNGVLTSCDHFFCSRCVQRLQKTNSINHNNHHPGGNGNEGGATSGQACPICKMPGYQVMPVAHKNLRPLFQDSVLPMEQSSRVIKSQLHHYRQIQRRMAEALKVLNTKYQTMEKALKQAKQELRETKETLRTVQQYTQKQKKEIDALSKSATTDAAQASLSSSTHSQCHHPVKMSEAFPDGVVGPLSQQAPHPPPLRFSHPTPLPSPTSSQVYYSSSEAQQQQQQQPPPPQQYFFPSRATSSSLRGSVSQEMAPPPSHWMRMSSWENVGAGGGGGGAVGQYPVAASSTSSPSPHSQHLQQRHYQAQDHPHPQRRTSTETGGAASGPLGWSATSSVMMMQAPPGKRSRDASAGGGPCAADPSHNAPGMNRGRRQEPRHRLPTPSPAPVPPVGLPTPTPSPLLATPLAQTILPYHHSGSKGLLGQRAGGNGPTNHPVAPSPLRDLLLRSSTMLSSNP